MRTMEHLFEGLLIDVPSLRSRREPRSSQVRGKVDSATWRDWPAYEIGSNPVLEEELAVGRRA